MYFQYNMPKGKFILKIYNLKRSNVLADTKVLFSCNFRALVTCISIDRSPMRSSPRCKQITNSTNTISTKKLQKSAPQKLKVYAGHAQHRLCHQPHVRSIVYSL